MNQDPKIPKRSPYLYYAIAALVVMMLLNVFVMPKVNNAQITQVDYSTFLQMIDDGKVDAVELDEEGQEIIFSSTDENGR